MLYSKAQQKFFVYQVSGGTWIQRGVTACVDGPCPGTYSLSAEVRAGSLSRLSGGLDYDATIPAGQVGVWAASGSASVTFDNFQVRDIAGPFEVDGRWFCNRGNVQVNSSSSNVLEATASNGLEDVLVRRGFRGEKYVATFKCQPLT